MPGRTSHSCVVKLSKVSGSLDEGSPVELPLLARERELRAVIEGEPSAASTWDSPVGSVVNLLRVDLSSEHRAAGRWRCCRWRRGSRRRPAANTVVAGGRPGVATVTEDMAALRSLLATVAG